MIELLDLPRHARRLLAGHLLDRALEAWWQGHPQRAALWLRVSDVVRGEPA